MGDDERAVGFCHVCDFAEGGDAAVVVVGDDGVAVGFDCVVGCHCVACYDYADGAFAPAFVETGVFWGWVAAVSLRGCGEYVDTQILRVKRVDC